MKLQLESSLTHDIIVVGSLNPTKTVQDRVRVLSVDGVCQALRATDYKDPPKVVVADEVSGNSDKRQRIYEQTSTDQHRDMSDT